MATYTPRACDVIDDNHPHRECSRVVDSKKLQTAETSFETVEAALEAAKEALRAAREARTNAGNDGITAHIAPHDTKVCLGAVEPQGIRAEGFWDSRCYEPLTFVKLLYNLELLDEMEHVLTNLDAKVSSTPVTTSAEFIIQTNGDSIDHDEFCEMITFLEHCSWDIGDELCQGGEDEEELEAAN